MLWSFSSPGANSETAGGIRSVWNARCTSRAAGATSTHKPRGKSMRKQLPSTTKFRSGQREGRSVQILNVLGVLTLVGDELANDIQIVDNGSDVAVLVDGVAAANSPFSGVTRVVVRGAAGDDTVTFSSRPPSALAEVKLQGGSGNDTLTLDAGTLDRLSPNATTNLTLIGGQGVDTLD